MKRKLLLLPLLGLTLASCPIGPKPIWMKLRGKSLPVLLRLRRGDRRNITCHLGLVFL